MSHVKDLSGPAAVEKLRELTGEGSTCMFASGLGSVPFHVCPMAVQQVDKDGCLWFFSGDSSVHNRLLGVDRRAQLIFCNPDKIEYVAIYGETDISRDRVKIRELWNTMAEAWFPEGEDDPDLTLIRMRPALVHYWDTENGKLVTYAKILASAVTGETPDTGVEGDLAV